MTPHEGQDSAFCIQLFCIDEKYEMRLIEFIQIAFCNQMKLIVHFLLNRSLDFLPAAFSQFEVSYRWLIHALPRV